MTSILADLELSCDTEVMEHVQTLMDWLLKWSSDTCQSAADEEKCWEAVYCVENIHKFRNAQEACR